MQRKPNTPKPQQEATGQGLDDLERIYHEGFDEIQEELQERRDEVKARAQKEDARVSDATETYFYVTLIADSVAELNEFKEKFNFPDPDGDDRFYDCDEIAERNGRPLTTPKVPLYNSKPFGGDYLENVLPQ
ncbi:MAG: DNA replication initiation control protein YabA [Oscillospiraceae bacterium]|jgi:hypothetical protein|nr:DNA replication initiation control protein YabA [Oscillospiraceae bacterium]